MSTGDDNDDDDVQVAVKLEKQHGCPNLTSQYQSVLSNFHEDFGSWSGVLLYDTLFACALNPEGTRRLFFKNGFLFFVLFV